MASILDRIDYPEDLKALSDKELKQLAKEIRRFLVDHVSVTGGHLGSNLGIVELTIALEQVLDTPKDKIIFDVGHQAYVHKILTGRKTEFDTLRRKNGLSGFPKREESEYDAFNTGHASTSISAAYGMAKARDLSLEDYKVACVIGDGSMTGGLVYEAMNNAGKDKTQLIVVLNDNEMSINHNVGSVATHLSRLRTRKGYLNSKASFKNAVRKHPILKPLYKALDVVKDKVKYLLVNGIIFEELGFTYLGPVDGHDIKALKEAFEQAKRLNEPVVVHVITQKGKGYEPAEEHPSRYHGVGPFDKRSGRIETSKEKTYAGVLADTLTKLGEQDPKVVAITAAMKKGTGIDGLEPKVKVFDVGIAEEHAVTFAGGMACEGIRPFVVIYSTFLQRAYDEIVHDVCLPNLPVVFAIDHSGVVGEDGETHQGVFDIAYLSHIPNMTLLAPSCEEQMQAMLYEAYDLKAPCAVRYPKGSVVTMAQLFEQAKGLSAELRFDPNLRGSSIVYQSKLRENKKTAFLVVGPFLQEALKAAKVIEAAGVFVSIVNVALVAPMDTKVLSKVFSENELVITVEDHVRKGGFGMQAEAFCKEKDLKASVRSLALPDRFIAQDSRAGILNECGISAEGMIRSVRNFYHIT